MVARRARESKGTLFMEKLLENFLRQSTINFGDIYV
jgi:hypothetical protein